MFLRSVDIAKRTLSAFPELAIAPVGILQTIGLHRARDFPAPTQLASAGQFERNAQLSFALSQTPAGPSPSALWNRDFMSVSLRRSKTLKEIR